jgi:hypothetical protein
MFGQLRGSDKHDQLLERNLTLHVQMPLTVFYLGGQLSNWHFEYKTGTGTSEIF